MSAESFEVRPDGGSIVDDAIAAYGEDTIFWNVDTQYDFMRPDGKLPVGEGNGAEDIEDALAEVTEIAREKDIRVVNTADHHNQDSAEFSEDPDFQETFPPHCLADSEGAEYVPATQPENPLELDWRDEADWSKVMNHEGDFVLYKDAFDVFAGEPESPHAEDLVETLDPDRAVVYGVATDVCVDYAIEGLMDQGVEVYVVEDATKGIDPEASKDSIQKWSENGATIGSTDGLSDYLESDGL
ncbi:cysteine hydrolase family protein [Candidatus Nanohalovita haloferacivicina]|uniref:cysteine hydrolase family protein n=1 Tax=Candidatus Nanohalovita haloferacivicina TaxID=2978046 RepID=UPI00325F9B4D|nr:Nicotinamidase [Candidatus Nanohalobia archaeon BNXNv]